MEISEKKAKEILDFLARKIKYDEFAVHDGKLVLCKDAYFYSLFFVDVRKNLISVVGRELKRKGMKMSYRSALRCMLKAANEGCRVETLHDEVMLHAYETIEQILVEMDLEEHG